MKTLIEYILGKKEENTLFLREEKSLADIMYNNKAKKRLIRHKNTNWLI